MRKMLLFTILFLFIIQIIDADTHHNGTIASDETWYATDNPHIVDGLTDPWRVLKVPAGVTLTIEAGCVIYVDGISWLDIYGGLQAIGTASDSIHFSGENGDDWYGIRFHTGSTGHLKYCSVKDGKNSFADPNYRSPAGIWSHAPYPDVNIEYCLLKDNAVGLSISLDNGEVFDTHNIYDSNQNNGLSISGDNITITNQTCTNNAGSGLYIKSSSNATIGSNVLSTGNLWGLKIGTNTNLSTSSNGNIPVAGNTNSDGIFWSGTATSSQTLRNFGYPYITDGVTLDAGSSLTIDDGVDILFMQDAQILSNGGDLVANGTSSQGISFTRRNSGITWGGLDLQLASSSTSFSFCTIEYASAGTTALKFYNSQPNVANCSFSNNTTALEVSNIDNTNILTANYFDDNNIAIDIYGCSDFNLGNQHFSNNSQALVMHSSSNVLINSGNTFSNNSWGISIDFGTSLDSLSYSNIDISADVNNDGIRVFGTDIVSNLTWDYTGLNYIITTDVSLSELSQFTLKEGIHLLFENNRSFTIEGTLNVNGSVSNPVVFTRRTPSDNWNGIILTNASNSNINHLTVEYAANQANSGVQVFSVADTFNNLISRYNSKGFYIEGVDNYNLTNSNTFSNNEDGIWTKNCDNFNIQNQTVTDNTGNTGGITFNSCENFTINTGNNISGNNWAVTMDLFSYPNIQTAGNIPIGGNTYNDGLYVHNWGYIPNDFTWINPQVPYIIDTELTVGVHKTLTLAPGCELLFAGWQRINIDRSSLIAEGTVTDSIKFSNWKDNEWWVGINFQGTGVASSLSYCIIENAKNGNGISASDYTLTVDNCLFKNNHNGMNINSKMPTMSNNRFINNNTSWNEGYGLYISYCNPVNINSTNYFSGNRYGVGLSGCYNINMQNIISENNTDCGIKFSGCDSLIVIDNSTLTGNNGYGAIFADNSGEITLGSGNIISSNNWPISINPGTFITASSTIPTSGNTNNGIRSTSGNCNKTGTWHKFTGIEYYVTENSSVTNAILTINPGTNIHFSNNTYLSFNAGCCGSQNGVINAVGTTIEPINFIGTGSSNSNGYFLYIGGEANMQHCNFADNLSNYVLYVASNGKLTLKISQITNCYNGIYLNNADNSSAIEDNLIDVTNVGIKEESCNNFVIGSGNTIQNANYGIYLNSCQTPQFASITIQNCNTAGLFLIGSSNLGTIDNLTLTGNNGYGALCFINSGNFILGTNITNSGNSYPLTLNRNSFPDSTSQIPTSGNTNDFIRLLNYTSSGTNHNGTFYNFSIPYLITETIQIASNQLITFAAGNTIYANENTGISCNGNLTLAGTLTEPIIFTKAGTNLWSGISFPYSECIAAISYTTIEYAQNGISVSFNNTHTPVEINIDHSTIQNNNRGINLYYGNVNLISQNKIMNNTQYGIYMEQDSHCYFGSSSSEWNIIENNTSYDFYNHSSNDVTAHYLYWGSADTTLIASHIYDKNDESWRGLVDYSNYLTTEPEGGLLSPTNIHISIGSGQVTLYWNAVSGATSYKVYSSDNATTGFTEDTSGTFSGTSWTASISQNKRFYYVKAVN